MGESLRKHHVSFRNAFSGLFWALRTQPNFKIHLTFSFTAILGGVFFQISKVEFLMILFTIMVGLVAEMINTSIEAMTDLITREWRQEARIAKDVSAGMMLTVAIGALIISCAIFGPRVLEILR